MKQESLLDNQDYYRRQKSRWIEMQPHYTQTPQYSYHQLQDQRNYQMPLNNQANMTYEQLQKQNGAQMEKPFKYPDYIHMNGNFYKSDKVPDLPKPSSKIPSATVNCYSCNQKQMIPGTATQFQCGICHSRNFCKPLYSIFQCGACKGKVLYPITGTQTIRCTKCGTINKLAVQKEEEKYTEDFEEKSQARQSVGSWNQLVDNDNYVSYPRLQW